MTCVAWWQLESQMLATEAIPVSLLADVTFDRRMRQVCTSVRLVGTAPLVVEKSALAR